MQDIISRSDKGEMTQVDFYQLLYVMLGGGVDAVSITTTCILQRMVDYPNVQKKVQAEIDAVVPTDRAVLVDDLDKLAFFWATVKETMRTSKMFSAVAIRSNSAPIRWRGYVCCGWGVAVVFFWGYFLNGFLLDHPHRHLPATALVIVAGGWWHL